MAEATLEERAAAIGDDDLRARVLRGLDVLAREYGEEWPGGVDAAALNMNDPRLCVLGQLETGRSGAGSYFGVALERIGGEVAEDPAAFGFSALGWGLTRGLAASSYGALTEAWRAVLGAA